MRTMFCLMLSAAFVAQAGETDDASVRAAIARVAPGAHIDSMRQAAMPGVTELIVGGQVVYLSNDGRYLMQGKLIDLEKGVDLTAGAENAVRRELLATVDASRKISFKAANEKHKVTVFTDVDCGYCRKLHKEMSAINAAGITVDYLMFPRAGQPSASYDKAGYVWCAVDRQDALTASMSAGELPADQRKACAHPITETMQLGQKLARLGTPTIIASDGSVLGGYLDPMQLAQRLTAIPAAATRP